MDYVILPPSQETFHRQAPYRTCGIIIRYDYGSIIGGDCIAADLGVCVCVVRRSWSGHIRSA